jgi:hypothetical protein
LPDAVGPKMHKSFISANILIIIFSKFATWLHIFVLSFSFHFYLVVAL